MPKWLEEFLLALLYSGLGIGLFGMCFLAIVKFSPFPVIKEIEEDQNTALAILIGAVFLGISIIIAASIAS